MGLVDLKEDKLDELIDDYCKNYLPNNLKPWEFKTVIKFVYKSAINFNELNLSMGWGMWCSSLYDSGEINFLTEKLQKEVIVFLLSNNLAYVYSCENGYYGEKDYYITSFSDVKDVVEEVNAVFQVEDRNEERHSDDFERVTF